MNHTVRTVCAHDCPDACSVLISLDGDGPERRALQFRGDPEHAVTQGFLCGKVNGYEQLVYSPDRILQPLKRVGKKGSGEFEPVSWDHAIEEIAGKIREVKDRSGGEALLQYYYAGTMGRVHRFSGDALFHRLGASKQEANICYFGADAGYRAAVGGGYGLDMEDSAHSDLILVWGCNVVTTQVHLMPFFDAARKRGARMIVIDPYRNRTARSADQWISIRPGTDTVLALGLMHQLEKSGSTDAKFLADRSIGYEKLRDAVLPKYDVDETARITGVPSEVILRLASDIAGAAAPLFKVGVGLGRSSHGATAVRSICGLAGAVAAYEKLGGGVLYDSGSEFQLEMSPVTRPDWQEKPTRVIRQTDLGPALTELNDPPIEFLYVHCANPLATVPLQNTVRRGLERDDLFTVVHERFLTDTAKFADIVLPAVTFAESSDLFGSYGHLYLQYGPAAIEPRGEARANLETFQAIGKALGFDDPWFDASVEDFIREIIDATDHPNFEGITADQVLAGGTIRLDIPRGESGFEKEFNTPSGKLEYYSEALAANGFGLPDYRGDSFASDSKKYPFRLVTPPAHAFVNSSFCELKKSRDREQGEPRAMLHPSDAASIESDDIVRLANERGDVEIRALITEDVCPGTIVVEGTWWPMFFRDGKGINVLTSNRLTEFGNGSTFHDNRVSLTKV